MVGDRDFVSKTTNSRKWHIGYRMIVRPMTLCDLKRSNTWPQYA